MKLYFSPLACSLASRIALYEAGADATFVEIDPKTKTTPDGEDFRARHMLGMVPLLELDDGSLLSENAAILQYIARTHADARLIPDGARGLACAARGGGVVRAAQADRRERHAVRADRPSALRA